MKIVSITTDSVELFKVLKFESLVSSGGQAKMVIVDGLVKVNGVIETRKRKKIVDGDIIQFNDHELKIKRE